MFLFSALVNICSCLKSGFLTISVVLSIFKRFQYLDRSLIRKSHCYLLCSSETSSERCDQLLHQKKSITSLILISSSQAVGQTTQTPELRVSSRRSFCLPWQVASFSLLQHSSHSPSSHNNINQLIVLIITIISFIICTLDLFHLFLVTITQWS